MTEQKNPTVMIFPRGDLTELDRARLESVGIVAIESNDPEKIIQPIGTTKLIKADDFTICLMNAIQNSDTSRAKITFANNLFQIMEKNHKDGDK